MRVRPNQLPASQTACAEVLPAVFLYPDQGSVRAQYCRWAVALLTSGLLCGQALAQQGAQLRTPLAVELRKQLLEALRDPVSTQFRREFISAAEDDKPIKSLCGELNTKNGYGGYVGFTRFVVTTDGVMVLEADERGAAFPAIWQTWCSRPLK